MCNIVLMAKLPLPISFSFSQEKKKFDGDDDGDFHISPSSHLLICRLKEAKPLLSSRGVNKGKDGGRTNVFFCRQIRGFVFISDREN